MCEDEKEEGEPVACEMAALGIQCDNEALLGTELDPLVAENAFKMLDEVPVYPLVLSVRGDIVSTVDTACTYEQLKSPQTHQYSIVFWPCSDCEVPRPPNIGQNERPQVVRHRIRLARKCWSVSARSRTESCSFRRICHSSCFVRIIGYKIAKRIHPTPVGIESLQAFWLTSKIDVLTFGFWPLRGDASFSIYSYSASRAERMSALELAIRSESKRFLSSPLVVQVLENIWSGKIVTLQLWLLLTLGVL